MDCGITATPGYLRENPRTLTQNKFPHTIPFRANVGDTHLH